MSMVILRLATTDTIAAATPDRLTLRSGHRLALRGTQRLTLYGYRPVGRLVLAGVGGGT